MRRLGPEQLTASLRGAGREVLDFFLPARCQLCESMALASYDYVFCGECGAEWPRLEVGCGCCGRPEKELGDPCPTCVADPPVYDSARSFTSYEGKAVEAIHALKYQGRRGVAALLGHWMAEAVPSLFPETVFDLVLPIPMNWRRRWWRGYNQAELLAAPIARALSLPLELDVGRKATKRQALLGKRERQENIAGAFTLSPRVAGRLHCRRILLVDDVFTTGATTDACARVLKAAGATRIDIFTLARTPK